MSGAPSARIMLFSTVPAVVSLLLLQANLPGLAQATHGSPKRFVARSAEVLRETPFAPVPANIVGAPGLLLSQPLKRTYREQLRTRSVRGRLVHHVTGKPLDVHEATFVQMADGTLYCSSVLNDALGSITGLRPIRMAASITAREGKISTLRVEGSGYEIGEPHGRAFVRALAAQGVYTEDLAREWRRIDGGDPATSRSAHFAATLAALASSVGDHVGWARNAPRPARSRPVMEKFEISNPFADSQGMLDWAALDEVMTTTFGKLLSHPLRAQGDGQTRHSPNSAVWFHDDYVFGQALRGHILDSRTPHHDPSPTMLTGKDMLPPLPPLFAFMDHDQVMHLNLSRFGHPSQSITALVPTYAHGFARQRFSPILQLAMAEHLVPPGVPPLAANLRLAMNNLATYLGDGLIERALFRGHVNGFTSALEDHLGTPHALAHLEYDLGLLQHPLVDIMGIQHIASTPLTPHPICTIH